jgi:hypothetical protein
VIPTIGRIVIYRSRTGHYDVPAIVTATRDTLHRPHVAAGHIPDLSSDTHVHLTVLTPGTPGQDSGEPFVAPVTTPGVGPRGSRPMGGTYQEWDIPAADGPSAGPGTWRWPDRDPREHP